MSNQKFCARHATTYPNGSIGWAPGGPMDCLGPHAKVQNCPVMDGEREVARLTCYATGYADTFFSIPACTRYRGQYITGYFSHEDFCDPPKVGIIFRLHNCHKAKFPEVSR